MAELFTREEVQAYLRREIADAGGVRKWLRKHRMSHERHIDHMFADGSAATLPNVLNELGFRSVTRYEPIPK